MADKEFGLNDVVEMKKPHPCGTNRWKIIRMGMDIRIKCEGCSHSVMIRWPRWVIVILLLSIMAPFTSIGFSNLIAFLYPIYGLLNLYLLVNILLYPILSKWK
ncbi:DUF951 family protein [Bacillus licheniformis]|nr:DUF951 family protein [Bacillus licheniformis]